MPLACLAIASLAEQARPVRLRVLLLAHNLEPDFRKRVEHYLASIDAEVTIKAIDPAPFLEICAARRQSPAKLAPLLWDNYVEEIPSRIVYVDSDTLAVRDASGLLKRELDGNIVAAVHDSAVLSDGRVEELCRKLDVDPERGYFNSGLLVIDTAKWLSNDIGRKALAVFHERPEILTWNDQCALNAVLGGRWQALPFCWNKLVASAPAEWPERILHFAGTFKPWRVGWWGRSAMFQKLVGPMHASWYAHEAAALNWPGFYTGAHQFKANMWTMGALAALILAGKYTKHTGRKRSPSLLAFAAKHPELLAVE
jgi:lipopolysaccharide biosynthesis glycosyltransferase